jgi:hypothetical protein
VTISDGKHNEWQTKTKRNELHTETGLLMEGHYSLRFSQRRMATWDQPSWQPIHTKFLPNRERPPTHQHRVQSRTDCSLSTRPPCRYVSVHEAFGGVEGFTMVTKQLLSGLRAAASGDTFEGCTVSQQPPKSILETESVLDDELG